MVLIDCRQTTRFCQEPRRSSQPTVRDRRTGAQSSWIDIRGQEARYRLEKGEGIKVFSCPERLHDLLAARGSKVADRAHCIVDAGQFVPGFSKTGSVKTEFFVHSPFAWRVREATEIYSTIAARWVSKAE